MKDEDKTKVELIKELKTLRKERGESTLDNITKRKQIEIREKQIVTKMDFLYKTALDFIQLDPKDDIYRFIGRKLKEIVGNSIVLANSYDKASDSFHVCALEGLREKIKKVLKIIGKDLFAMSFPINNEEAKNQLISGELLKIPGGLYELTFGQIPKSICHVLEKFLNVGEIYFSGFAREKELFGNIIIIMPKGAELNNREFINTFIKQAAIALQKKQAEEGLKNSEERLKILFDYAPDAYYINDVKGKFVDGNKAAERLIGYKKEELIEKNFFKLKLLSLADMPKAAKLLAKNIRRLPTGPDEFVLNRKDNSKAIVEISTYPVKIKGRTLALGLARDITKRKQAEVELQESKEKYRALYDNAPLPYQSLNKNSRFKDVNPAWLRALGYDREEIIGKWFGDFLHPDWKPHFEKIFSKFKRRGYVHDVQFKIKHKDGHYLDISFEGYVGHNPDGSFKQTYCVFQDITERKKAEEKIKHLNLVLRAIRNVNELIVKEKNRERLLKGACENLVKTRGYHNTWIVLLDEEGKLKTYAEAGLGEAFLPMIEILKKGKLTTCSQKALKQQEVIITENPVSTCLECPLAQKYSDRGAMTIRLEYNGKVYGLISVSIPAHLAVDQEEQGLFKEVAEDIAFSMHNIELDEEHKQAEENLKSAKDELQMILDSVPAIIFYKDTEGRVIRTNKALADSLKVSIKDVIGKTTEELFPKEQAVNMRKDDKEVMISGKAKKNIIQPYTTPEGVRWVITDKIPYRDKKGKVTGVIGLSKDITVQRKSEQELTRTYQRLKKTMDAAIDTMSKIIEAKDPYTSGHQHRVCQLAVPLAQELGFSSDKIEGIRIASLIHDIGKIGLPTEILSKPTKLTDIEFSLIKGHSQIGYDILKSIDFSYPIAQIVLQHHERLNGSGYPNKLKGDKTLLEAKIIGVADVVEAMSSFRPYRPALGIDKALEEISQNRGILYDPEVVDACLKLFKEKGFKFK